MAIRPETGSAGKKMKETRSECDIERVLKRLPLARGDGSVKESGGKTIRTPFKSTTEPHHDADKKSSPHPGKSWGARKGGCLFRGGVFASRDPFRNAEGTGEH